MKGKLKAKFHKAKGKVKQGGKNFLNNVKQPVMDAGLITAGVLASSQFLNLPDLMKAQYAKDPNAFYFKHQGAIKVILPLMTIGMWKSMPNWAKMIAIGIIVHGIIQEVKVFTTGADGVSKLKSIGEAEMNDAINSLAADIKSVAEQSRTSVGAPSWQNMNELQRNSTTSVGGMGMGMEMEMN